jgi:hypothetical protein
VQAVKVVASADSAADPARILLEGLAAGEALDELHSRVGVAVGDGPSVAGRELLDVAAAAFLACGASSGDPMAFDELEQRYLPDVRARGNTARQKRRYALTAAVLIAAGVEPEDTGWWRVDDLWSHAFDTVVLFVRAASERRQLPIATICLALAHDA